MVKNSQMVLISSYHRRQKHQSSRENDYPPTYLRSDRLLLRSRCWDELIMSNYGKHTTWHDPEPIKNYKAIAQQLADALKYALHCEECLGLAANPTAIQKYREAIAEWERSQ